MKMIFMVAFVMVCAQFSLADSTFVGNGGNAGDLELRVSKLTLESTLERISEDGSKVLSLCRCSENYNQYPACKSLEKLTNEQVHFCGKFIYERAAELSQMLKNKVTIQWTDQSMQVKENNANLPVDAMANFENKTILINKENYLSLESYQRNFLLGHEIFHLSQWENSKIKDEQPIGVFDTNTGGRVLLNAAAAALVMYSIENNIADKHESDLYRSRRDKQRWLSLEYSAFKAKEDLNTLYIPESYTGLNLGFQHLITNEIGVGLNYSSYKSKDTFLDTIEVTDQIDIYSIGAFYRFFPFHDLFSFEGQSFGTIGLRGDFLQGQFELKEPPLAIQEKVKTNYLTLVARYYIPLQNGFWLQAGADLNQPNYKYSQNIDAQFSQLRVATNVGVSYGF